MTTHSPTRKTPPRKADDLSLAKIRSAVSNGTSLFIADVDQRGRWVRRFRDLLHEYHSDLGGEEVLSEGQRSLVRRAAMLEVQLAFIEERWAQDTEGRASPRGLDRYQRAVNTLRRVIESLNLNQGRGAKDITPNATARGIEIIRAAASR